MLVYCWFNKPHVAYRLHILFSYICCREWLDLHRICNDLDVSRIDQTVEDRALKHQLLAAQTLRRPYQRISGFEWHSMPQTFVVYYEPFLSLTSWGRLFFLQLQVWIELTSWHLGQSLHPFFKCHFTLRWKNNMWKTLWKKKTKNIYNTPSGWPRLHQQYLWP